MIQAELRIAAGNRLGSSIPLPQGKFLVGREEDCHLRPNSDLVSRHHCVFTVDDFSVRLRDLGSTNGTFVNGERLKGAVMLKQGDRVLIGKLDFEVVMKEAVAAPPSPGVDTVMIAGSPDSASVSTQFSMPVVNLTKTIDDSGFVNPAEAAGQAPPAPAPVAEPVPVPSSADTQMLTQQGMMQPGMMPPGYGMPVGYPQQPYMQNPYGYPSYPQQMPMGGYYGQPMGYPQMPQQMMPPGYGMPQPGMMMPQQPMPEAAPEAPAAPSASSLGVKLPDPATSGAKEPPPAAPAAAPSSVAGSPVVHIPTAAADIIKQYQTRR
ncbi:MAG: FHA domain-containing protein [Planctomycetota bacterium]|jgi:predicted component of type VI protein secretion system|nr:MAG: FHA domain-containing protein [Planctomycetota bacterium]